MITADQLKPFCGSDPEKPWLHLPFSNGDFTFATDGRIAVRVPRLVDVGEVEKAPNAAVLFRTAFVRMSRAKWQALPILPATVEGLQRLEFGPGQFNAQYVHLIAGLPSAQLSPGEDDLSALRFRSQPFGLLGLLMPLRREGA